MYTVSYGVVYYLRTNSILLKSAINNRKSGLNYASAFLSIIIEIPVIVR